LQPIRNADPAKVAALGATLVPLKELLRESGLRRADLPASTTSASPDQCRSTGTDETHRVPRDVARGPVVDETALTQALKEKRIAGAGLDVFEQEPVAARNPLARYGARDREPACTLLDRRMFNAIATDA